MITVDELLEEFNRLKNRPADGLTTQEISEKMGWSILLTRQVIKFALKAGTMLRTKKYVEYIDGRRVPIISYKFKLKSKVKV